MTDPCPSDDMLALHVDGRLSPHERAQVGVHLDACPDCRNLLGALAAARTRTQSTRSSEVFPVSTWRWEPGLRIGRYVLQGALGRGGMGEVYEALDVKLRRLVAIKVARPGPEDQARSERVVAEGKVLASLDHPNVVRVFDAGTHEGAAYIVIERAEGSSLRRWLAAAPRHVRDVERLFRGVAHGCAAIHAAGLVHRDIKPDNILVSNDGEGLLSDFGLASASRRGVSGTPGYIAPEVEAGSLATAASDQFSFCVTFAEALQACRRGRIPRYARDAISRGTAEKPLDRYESMSALVAQLERPRVGTQALAISAGAVSTVAMVAALGAPSHDANPCNWKDATWSHADLDDPTWSHFKQEWTDAAQLACDRHADVATRDCLQQLRRDAAVLLDAMLGAKPSSHPLAPLDPRSCEDSSRTADPAAVTRTHAVIARATAARIEGRDSDAQALAAEASALALATGDPRVLSAALQESAHAAFQLGQIDVAAEKFESVHWTALRAGEPGLAADGAIELIDLFSNDHAFVEAQRWRQHASSALNRSADPESLRWAHLEVATSILHQRLRDFPEAIAASKRALEHTQRLVPPPGWALVGVEARIGGALDAAGDSEGARIHLERALQWQLELYGENHPGTAKVLYMLGALHLGSLYSPDEGVALTKRAIAILDQPDAPPSLVAAMAYEVLGHTFTSRRQLVEARVAVERCVELYGALYPREHPRQLTTYVLRANLAEANGKLEEASRWAEDGLLMANRTLGGRAALTGSMSTIAGELALGQDEHHRR